MPTAATRLGLQRAKEAQADRQHVHGCFHCGVHEAQILRQTDDGAAIGYLEDNVHPHIHYQLFSTGRHSSDYNATLTAIKEISANLEAYRMYARAGQEASPSKTLNQMEMVEIGLGPGAEEDVGALSWDEKKKGKGKGNPPP